MPSPTHYVYDGDGASVNPRRPGIDDVGSAAFVDDQEFPPDPGEHPMAEEENQREKIIVGLSRMVGVLKLSCRFVAGVPTLEHVVTPGTLITAPDFTVTDNGVGDTSIEWPADSFPTLNCLATGLTIVDDIDVDRIRALPLTNGVQVKTALGAVGTDVAFTVIIH